MSEQWSFDSSGYWVSMVTVAPAPEIPERAIVAAVFGNGRPVAFRYERDLPRLSGLAPIDSRRSYAALLGRAQQLVESGEATNESLTYALGPQFRIEVPVAITQELNDRIIDTLARSVLRSPPSPPRDAAGETVVRFARARLGDALNASRINAAQIVKLKKPQEVYGALNRLAPPGLPRIGAAVRGMAGRDLWIDAVAFAPDLDHKQVADHASRVNYLFFEMDKRLRQHIRERERREFKLVAVIERIGRDSPEDLRQVRSFALDQFGHYADEVIDAEHDDAAARLNKLGAWAEALRAE